MLQPRLFLTPGLVWPRQDLGFLQEIALEAAWGIDLENKMEILCRFHGLSQHRGEGCGDTAEGWGHPEGHGESGNGNLRRFNKAECST